MDLTKQIDSSTESKSENFWIEELRLRKTEKDCIQKRVWLTDNVFNAAQKLIQKKFPKIDGLQSVALAETLSFSIFKGTDIKCQSQSLDNCIKRYNYCICFKDYN